MMLVKERDPGGGGALVSVWDKFAVDSPLEGNGFELSVPRCLATANSVGADRSRGKQSASRLRAADTTGDPEVAIRAHPHLGRVRYDGCPSRRGLWRRRRCDREHSPKNLTGRFIVLPRALQRSEAAGRGDRHCR